MPMRRPDVRYEIILYWSDEDAAVIAEVPELPGCVSDGETYAEAVVTVEDAMRAWVATARELGREVPAPKGRRLRFA